MEKRYHKYKTGRRRDEADIGSTDYRRSCGDSQAVAESRLKNDDKVVFTDINAEKGHQLMTEWRNQGYEATFIQQDVTSWKDTEKVVSETIELYGRMDVLIISAGVTSQKKVGRYYC